MGDESRENNPTKKQYFDLDKIIESPNIAGWLTKENQKKLGKVIIEDYARDLSSRADWEGRMIRAVELALQVQQMKNFPWTGCSNVKFPLLTIAALQFLARISIMTKGSKPVKVEMYGPDTTGEKSLQAQRLSNHMSMQLSLENPHWHDQDEQTKLAAAIMGCSFKKVYFDTIIGKQVSEHVPAQNLVLDYFTKDFETSQRFTHRILMPKNKAYENFRRGVFLEIDTSTPIITAEQTQLEDSFDDINGMQPPATDSWDQYQILEQHRWFDFDGDGYKEPYIVSIRQDTGQLLRIVARFVSSDVHRLYDPKIRQLDIQATREEDMKKKAALEKAADALEKSKDNHVLRIDATQYFTRYAFIPSPDGGIYGLGLGALMGPLNESVNTLINQNIDAGTMGVSAGGFLGRGVKMKGGKTTFDPFEWKIVDSVGADLKNNIVPLPVREPSGVLFQMLQLLITYSEKLSGATDIMSGVSPGQNTPAETSRNTVEQGMMLFSGIYSRMYRSFTDELRIMFKNNQMFLETSPNWFELTEGPDRILAPDDYKKHTFLVGPSVGPEAVSQSQKIQKAEKILAAAKSQPGFNIYLVTKNWLEAIEADDIDSIFPNPEGPRKLPAPLNPKIELEKQRLKQDAQEHADKMLLETTKLRRQIEVDEAHINELNAKAENLRAQAKSTAIDTQLSIVNSQLEETKARHAALISALDLLSRHQAQKASASEMKQPAGSDEPPTPAANPAGE